MTQPQHEYKRGFFGHLRDWTEAFLVAFLVAMFVRMFVVELFRIPSGSMSPTLIGDIAAELDVDNDGELDQVVFHGDSPQRYQVFYRQDGIFEGVDNFAPTGFRMSGIGRLPNLSDGMKRRIHNKLAPRFDRILVNKFAYWFRDAPERGEIMVFKVPKPEFNPDRPFFIKRVAGLGGEIVGIDRGGDLIADGKKVEEPVIHDRVFYSPRGNYLRSQNGRIATPDDAFLAFGDNSFSSSDSRVWGPVPNENLKGLAFFRYWPRDKISFLD